MRWAGYHTNGRACFLVILPQERSLHLAARNLPGGRREEKKKKKKRLYLICSAGCNRLIKGRVIVKYIDREIGLPVWPLPLHLNKYEGLRTRPGIIGSKVNWSLMTAHVSWSGLPWSVWGCRALCGPDYVVGSPGVEVYQDPVYRNGCVFLYIFICMYIFDAVHRGGCKVGCDKCPQASSAPRQGFGRMSLDQLTSAPEQ